MRKILLSILVFLAGVISNQSAPLILETAVMEKLPVDGPYVFYHNKTITVKHIDLEGTKLVVREKSYPIDGPLPSLTCGVDKNEGNEFQFTLQSKINVPPSVYSQPEKLLAISDIEGDFETFVSSLQGNGVIDDSYNWTFGNGHLVMLGDFFDRGINVTACLWLIYKLEQEAIKKGGCVHFIIGNHEEMNMRGDLRYLKPKYNKIAEILDINYIQLYGNNTELGRWLRSKNVIEKIGNTIYVHGGISPELASSGLTIDQINTTARTNFGLSLSQVKENGPEAALVMHTNLGPMWYRGYFTLQLDESAMTVILSNYEAEKIVVGHTVMDEVCSYYNDKLIAIDVKHQQCLAKNMCNALLLEKDTYFKSDVFGNKSLVKEGEQLIVGGMRPAPAQVIEKTDPLKMQATLLAAVREGNIDIVAKYLVEGNDINRTFTAKQYTLLHYAIKYGQFEITRLLIEKGGANTELRYEDQTSLMYAIKNQQTRIINYLIAKGAQINAQTNSKKTPLFYVAEYGTVNTARLLVNNGADVHFKDANGRTAADYALDHQNESVAIFLRNLK